jgi:phage terminase large subunit-like protein
MLTEKEIAVLSPKEQQEYLMLLEEEEKNKIDRYNTGKRIHKIQMEFHKSQLRNRWLFGGNRTGKTVGGAVEAVWTARGTHPYRKISKPTKGWVVSLTNEVQRDVAQKEVLNWLNPDWILDAQVRSGRKDDLQNAIIDFIIVKSIHGGNSEIGFKSVDQGREKFQGTSRDWIWFDEEPPKEIYDECKMRTIDVQGSMWGTMTPLKGLTWCYNTIYLNEVDDPQVICWNMQWEDNPWLRPDEIQALVATLSEEEREARQFGRFVALSGLVYKEFKEDIHVIDPFVVPKGWYDNISIDPGYNAPLACHFYACDGDGVVYVIAEHYEREQVVPHHAKKIHGIAKSLGWPKNANGKLKALIDSDALKKTVMSEKSTVQLFSENLISCNAKVDKSVLNGIMRVKQYLKLRPHKDTDKWPKGRPSLFIFRTCPNMIKEFKGYRWDEAKDDLNAPETPKKHNDHALDNLRYYIMSKPVPFAEEKFDDRYVSGGKYFRSELFMKGLKAHEIKRLEKEGLITIIGE